MNWCSPGSVFFPTSSRNFYGELSSSFLWSLSCTDSRFSPFIILTPTPPHSHLSCSELNERGLLHLEITRNLARGSRPRRVLLRAGPRPALSGGRCSRFPQTTPRPGPAPLATRPGAQGPVGTQFIIQGPLWAGRAHHILLPRGMWGIMK